MSGAGVPIFWPMRFREIEAEDKRNFGRCLSLAMSENVNAVGMHEKVFHVELPYPLLPSAEAAIVAIKQQ